MAIKSLESEIKLVEFFAFFKSILCIILLAISQNTGIVIQDKESMAAVLLPDIPSGRSGNNSLAIPRDNLSGDVVLTNKRLAINRKNILEAKSAPCVSPSPVILKYPICDKTCLPELKNTGNIKETKIKDAYLLTLDKINLKELLEIAADMVKNKNSPE